MLTPEELRETLLARRKELTARVRDIERDFRHDEQPLEKDSQEQALQLENDDVLNALDHAGRRELESIARALARMDSGEYGICAGCEESISPMRLRALPTAEYCIRCAEKMEK
jgi:RNA polymerase-binding transcription factor DksA